MTKTALRSAGQSMANYRSRNGVAGPLTRMARNQAPLSTAIRPRWAPGSGTLAHQDGKGLPDDAD